MENDGRDFSKSSDLRGEEAIGSGHLLDCRPVTRYLCTEYLRELSHHTAGWAKVNPIIVPSPRAREIAQAWLWIEVWW